MRFANGKPDNQLEILLPHDPDHLSGCNHLGGIPHMYLECYYSFHYDMMHIDLQLQHALQVIDSSCYVPGIMPGSSQVLSYGTMRNLWTIPMTHGLD